MTAIARLHARFFLCVAFAFVGSPFSVPVCMTQKWSGGATPGNLVSVNVFFSVNMTALTNSTFSVR